MFAYDADLGVLNLCYTDIDVYFPQQKSGCHIRRCFLIALPLPLTAWPCGACPLLPWAHGDVWLVGKAGGPNKEASRCLWCLLLEDVYLVTLGFRELGVEVPGSREC